MLTISVVIPAWNEEKYIEEALDLIAKQTIQPLEVIVVDNNSVDNTVAIAKRKGARVIKEARQGITPARNAGFNAAKGDIIARTDADSHVPANWLETMLEIFNSDNAIVGVSGPAVFFPEEQHPHVLGSKILTKTYVAFAGLIHGHEIMIGPNMGLKKSAWEEIKDKVEMNDSIVHEDIDLAYHLSEIGLVSFDKRLIVEISARRIKNNPKSFFIDYVFKHKQGLLRRLKWVETS
jgi:glycosyltransferase involved in cell wall biosynthesis